jgi:hypothetical protein
MEGWVKRPMLQFQNVVGRPLNVLGDFVAMRSPEEQRAQDQHVERALKQLGSIVVFAHRHGSHSTLKRVDTDHRRLRRAPSFDGRRGAAGRGSPGARTFAVRRSCGKSLGFRVTNEIGFAGLRTAAEGLVIGIGRNPHRRSWSHELCLLAHQIHDTADQSAPHVEPREHLFVFLNDFVRHEPCERVTLDPRA